MTAVPTDQPSLVDARQSPVTARLPGSSSATPSAREGLGGRWGGRGSLPSSGIGATLGFGRARGGCAARRRGAATARARRDRHLTEVTVHQVVELVGAERLLLDEPGDHHVEEAPVLGQELVGPAAGAIHDVVDLAVDEL